MQKREKFDKITQEKDVRLRANYNGASPSGKATDSDSVIRVFESLRPSQLYTVHQFWCAVFLLGSIFISYLIFMPLCGIMQLRFEVYYEIADSKNKKERYAYARKF